MEKFISGIYQIRNLINNKIYIGSATNFNKRWNRHKRDLRKNIHNNSYLQNAWNKYGEENFIFESMQIVNEYFLLECEQWWIDNTQCMYYQNGYNISPTAGSSFGIRRTNEYKEKMTKSKTGSVPWNKGIKTEIKPWNKGKTGVYSRNTLELMSENRKGLHCGKNHWTYMKEFTKEHKKKLSINNARFWFGKKREIDTVEKMRKNSPKGEDRKNSILKQFQVDEIRVKYQNEKISQQKLANQYGVKRATIQSILENRSWYNENYIPPQKRTDRLIKLNKKLAEQIREEKKELRMFNFELADKYNVSTTSVSNIINNKVWK